jgi:hypothetical protein
LPRSRCAVTPIACVAVASKFAGPWWRTCRCNRRWRSSSRFAGIRVPGFVRDCCLRRRRAWWCTRRTASPGRNDGDQAQGDGARRYSVGWPISPFKC